jgi:hypothetical protein
MADLEKGTVGKDTVAPLGAEGGATDASAMDAFASNSREFGESKEDGALDESDGKGGPARAPREQASSEKSRSKAPWLWGTLALGMAAGWLGHGFQASGAQKEAGAAVVRKSNDAAGPCNAWADIICEGMGALAHECTTARAASSLLSDSACVQAQEGVLTKIDALKAGRVQCNELTSKLCVDLGPEGKGCELVKAKEPTFSLEECQNMTTHYRQVLARAVELQEKGTLPRPPGNTTITRPN